MDSKGLNFDIKVVTSSNLVPYITPCSYVSKLRRTSDCMQPGLNAEHIGLLLQLLHANYTLITTNTRVTPGVYSQFSKQIVFINNSWANLAAKTYTPSKEREQFGKFTKPFMNQYLALIAPKRRLSEIGFWSNSLNILLIFDPSLWFAILLLTIVYKSHHLNKNLIGRRFQWLSLFLGIFLGLYQAKVLTSMLILTSGSDFTNFNEFIDILRAGRLKLIMPKGVIYNDWIQNATQGPWQQLRWALKHNPILYDSDFEESEDAMMSYIQQGLGTRLQPMVSAKRRTADLCYIRWVTMPELGTDVESAMFDQNTPDYVIEQANKVIDKHGSVFEAITIRYDRLLDRKTRPCPDDVNTEITQSTQPLAIKHFIGALLLLLVGVIVALGVLTVEKSKPADQTHDIDIDIIT